MPQGPRALHGDILIKGYLDLDEGELRNAVLQNLSTEPSPIAGRVFYDTDDNAIKVYNGSAWVILGAGFTQEQIEDLVGAMVTGNVETGITVTYDDGAGKIDFALSDEYLQDVAGAMVSGGTESGITVSYDDTNARFDFTVTDAPLLGGQNSAYHLARANHTGTQTASTISDFAEATSDQVGTMVTGNTETGIAVTYDDSDNTLDFVVGVLNSLPAPTGDLSLNSQKITNLANGTAATDAVTVGQLNSVSSGIDWKASVRAATAAAGTLASSFENGDTIDTNVTLVTGDRILIKDQAAGAENGIYTVNASGAPTRATDADASAEVTGGLAVWVNEGTANADTGWVLTTNDAITLGSTSLTFTQFSGLGQVTAGNALTKTGNTLDVAVDSTTVEISGDALRLAATAAGDGLTGGGGSALAVGAGTGVTVTANAVALDTAVAVRKAGGTLTGGANSEAKTHSLANQWVDAFLINPSSPFDRIDCYYECTDANTVTFYAAAGQNLPAYRWVVQG